MSKFVSFLSLQAETLQIPASGKPPRQSCCLPAYVYGGLFPKQPPRSGIIFIKKMLLLQCTWAGKASRSLRSPISVQSQPKMQLSHPQPWPPGTWAGGCLYIPAMTLSAPANTSASACLKPAGNKSGGNAPCPGVTPVAVLGWISTLSYFTAVSLACSCATAIIKKSPRGAFAHSRFASLHFPGLFLLRSGLRGRFYTHTKCVSAPPSCFPCCCLSREWFLLTGSAPPFKPPAGFTMFDFIL